MRKIQYLAGVFGAAFLTAAAGVCGFASDDTAETEIASEAKAQVASADETAGSIDVVEDWMVPIYGDELKDGVYEIDVLSSSTMFKIEKCELTVESGEMKAVMTLSGTGYLKLFMGTGEEAVEASEEDYIPFAEGEDGAYSYEVPVEALDMGIDCAAFSKRKEKWYDRVLVFESTSLPMEAFKELKMTTAEDLALEDGSYLVDAALSGGSGKASIESPAEITVENGEITLKVVFGSPNYDYMLVSDEKYEPVNTEGNSTFLIPVPGFDYNIPVVADTIAMSVPHEIEYTISLDSAAIEKVE